MSPQPSLACLTSFNATQRKLECYTPKSRFSEVPKTFSTSLNLFYSTTCNRIKLELPRRTNSTLFRVSCVTQQSSFDESTKVSHLKTVFERCTQNRLWKVYWANVLQENAKDDFEEVSSFEWYNSSIIEEDRHTSFWRPSCRVRRNFLF